tara:strand:+ start:159967 stop:161136 length:1170 start_codon:yes stop_codon:yes gene_type:complete
MRGLFSGLLLSISCNVVTAQVDFGSRIQSKVDCDDISFTALSLIPEFYHKNQKDSIIHFIRYWEDKCDKSHFSQEVRLLYEIERGVFDNKEIDFQFFRHLMDQIDYIDYMVFLDTNSQVVNSLSGVEKNEYYLISEFYLFTSLWAQEILDKNDYPACSDEKDILLAYAGHVEEFFESISNNSCESILNGFYISEVSRLKSLGEVEFGFLTGVWKPFNNAATLGLHPIIGLYFGTQRGKVLFDLTMLLRFVNSPSTYTVLYEDSLISTKYFLGGYIGADVGYELLRTPTTRVYMLGGIGYDGFDTLESDPDVDDEPSKAIGSLNLNTGIGSKWFINESMGYLGLEVRYNFVNYRNSGGTDFTGNALSVRLLFGILGNYTKQTGLKSLRYR